MASLQADLDALEASKGQPNGLATLNSSGKLAQMPSASDVGALPITGGEMQGALKLKANQYGGSGPADEKYALDCQNSNIVNVNRILTADPAGSASEGGAFKEKVIQMPMMLFGLQTVPCILPRALNITRLLIQPIKGF